MSQSYHTICSSDDSDDSLPDLHSRVVQKLAKTPLSQPPVHTISSDEDEDIFSNRSCEEEKNKIVTNKIKDEDLDLDIQEFTQAQDDKIKPCFGFSFSKGGKKHLAPLDPFEEELPDIQNFTILTSGLDHEDDEKATAPIKLHHTKKLRTEEVRDEKEAKRRERELIKQKRAMEKAESKAQKEAERTSRRAMKPGECMKYVKVQLDRHLLEQPEGSQVIGYFVAAEIKYEVIDSPVSCAATIVRIDPLTLKETLAEDAVILLPVQEFTNLVERQIYCNGIGGLSQLCKQWQTLLGNLRLTLIVAGLQTYMRGKRTNKNQEFRNAVLGEEAQLKRKKKKKSEESTSNVSRVDIETALVTAQLECGVNHRIFSDAEKVAAFITQITKSLAEAPYKREKEDSFFSWYAEGSCSNCVKVDKSGVGLYKLWHQQLQQFNNVGIEVAQAIAREYPSPLVLVQAYRQSSTEKEASLLLANIPIRRGIGPLVSTRRIGPELSKKIHLFFTTSDPDKNLGQI